MDKFAEEAHRRVRCAREIADHFRHDESLHRLSMAAVFLFEDLAFAISELAEKPIKKQSKDSGTLST